MSSTIGELDDVGGDLRRRGSAAVTASPSLTMKSWPSPEMIAVRIGPSAPASSAMPASFNDGSAGGGATMAAGVAAAAARAPAAARRARRRGTRRGCGPAAAATTSDAAVRAAARFRSRARRRAARSPAAGSIGAGGIAWFDVAAPASHARERRADEHDRRRPLQVHRAALPDRSTRTLTVCYYSSCTLHRLVLRVDSVPPLNIVAVIPARYASTRLPGKALADIDGRPMIEHVYRRVAASPVVVAGHRRDRRSAHRDARAATSAARCGSRKATHETGTDRLAEVAASLDCDVVVNVQGDEPLIDPRAIDEAGRAVRRPIRRCR